MCTVKEIISNAGGVAIVAKAINLSDRSVYKWIEKNAFPRSEYTGETEYVDQIAVLCKIYSREIILQIGNPRKVKNNSKNNAA